MKSVFHIIKEQYEHFQLARRLSLFEMKSKNRSNYLGSLWEIINPLIQLLIYWFVFQNIRQQDNIQMSDGSNVSYVYWLVTGFVLWIFFYKSTIEGSNSIYTRIKILSKMNFPMSIVPSFVIFSHFYVHIVILAIAILLLHVGGYYVNIYYLQLLYFIPATLFFLYALALITSTISTIIRDAHMLLNAVLRMFLYVSPVLWEIGNMPEPYGTIAKLNPLYYLIEGYRAALFGTEWFFINQWEYSLYFGLVTIILFLIGSTLHIKFRKHFVDLV